MSSTLDRFAGHRYAPGWERADEPAMADGFFTMSSSLGELWPVIAALALMYVLIARGARKRRIGTDSKLIRDLETQARRESFRRIGTDLRLRYEAGETGER